MEQNYSWYIVSITRIRRIMHWDIHSHFLKFANTPGGATLRESHLSYAFVVTDITLIQRLLHYW